MDPDNSSNGFKVVQIWSLSLTKKESKLTRDLESELDRDLELNRDLESMLDRDLTGRARRIRSVTIDPT